MNIIDKGIQKGLIKFDSDYKYITYIEQNKKRNYSNPEEQVQAETYLSLILTKKYPKDLVKVFVPITMGSTTKEADIKDNNCSNYIKCKISEPLIKLTKRLYGQALRK